MAALPILMIWIYLSWVIVLIGLEMTYATQNLRTIRQDIRGKRVNFASLEFIALTVLLCIGRRFYLGKPALGHEALSSRLEIPSRLLHSILDELTRLGLIVATAQHGDWVGYQPAQALEKIKLHEVIRGLAADGVDYSHLRKTVERRVVAGVADVLKDAERRALAEMTLRDLVLQTETARSQQEDPVAVESVEE
jgi:membrane protein